MLVMLKQTDTLDCEFQLVFNQSHVYTLRQGRRTFPKAGGAGGAKHP